jgi:hypothetical protein
VGIDYGYCDPYGKVEFAGIELKTKRGEGKDVSLNETLNVPVMEPMMSTAIKFSMYANVSSLDAIDCVVACLFDHSMCFISRAHSSNMKSVCVDVSAQLFRALRTHNMRIVSSMFLSLGEPAHAHAHAHALRVGQV